MRTKSTKIFSNQSNKWHLNERHLNQFRDENGESKLPLNRVSHLKLLNLLSLQIPRYL